MKLIVILAVFGAAAVAAGVAMLCAAAGVIVAGVEAIAGAYVAAYVVTRRGAR